MNQFSKSITIILLCIFTSSVFTSCNDNDKSCQETACTLIFVTINLTIVDQNQDPIVLDSYELINLETNTPITLSFSAAELTQFAQQGIYPVMDDLSMQENQQLNIQFRGFINNQEVITQDYTVAKDCCHVGLISGDTEVTL